MNEELSYIATIMRSLRRTLQHLVRYSTSYEFSVIGIIGAIATVSNMLNRITGRTSVRRNER